MMLSLLIPTIPDRAVMFNKLLLKVYEQVSYCQDVHPTLGEVEVLFDDSKKFLDGGLSIGKKRETLVKEATGKFSCFLDDDEDISPNYVETLLRLCKQNKDVCTFRNISKFDNYWCVVDMHLFYENEQATPERIVRRAPWHTCPVKSEYAKLYAFDDINYGEDFSWMERVLKHCQTEAHTDAILHCYNHSSKTSEADKITNYVFTEPGRTSNP